ncbi:MAG: nucleotidyltransferase domain-containing protein [Firmicutes bacterium]|nr:nucleotidyltransferase domain-containing protein [Bacillota bacterium]
MGGTEEQPQTESSRDSDERSNISINSDKAEDFSKENSAFSNVVETIELEKYEKGDRPGTVKAVGMATYQEVFDKLQEHLEKSDMLPDEYFKLSYRVTEPQLPLPKDVSFICNTDFGGSEGIYVDIYAKSKEYPEGLRAFAVGKILNEDYKSFMRMGVIATECSLMLNGGGMKLERNIGIEQAEEKVEQKSEAKVPETKEKTTVDEYKEKTLKSFNPISPYAENTETELSDIEEDARNIIAEATEDMPIEVVDVAVYGSRSRGLENEKSDLDIVFEYKGDVREDTVFNILNENSKDYYGVEFDFNPIRAEETGTLEQYLPEADKYLEREIKNRAKSVEMNIIGNTVYRYIPQKRYKKFPGVDGMAISERLSNEDIKHSGKINGDGTVTITYSANDKEKVLPIFDEYARQSENKKIIFPDNSIDYGEMVEYGYKEDIMHPLTKEVALDLWENKNLPVYKLYEDNTESLVDNIEDIQNHKGIFGIETADWDRYIKKQNILNNTEESHENTEENHKTTEKSQETKDKEPAQMELIDGVLPKSIAIASILEGTGFENGKHRVAELYDKNLTNKERAEVIKKEYGIGGRYNGNNIPNALVGTQSDSKGLQIEWNDANRQRVNKLLTWSQVEKIISELVEKDAYITPEEMARYNKHIETEAKIKLLAEGDVINVNGDKFTVLAVDDSRIKVQSPEFENDLSYIVGDNHYINKFGLEKYGFDIEGKTVEKPETDKEDTVYRFFRTGNESELKILFPKDDHHFTSSIIDKDVIDVANKIYEQDGKTETFFSMLLAYANTETFDDSTLFYMDAKNEYNDGIALMDGFTDETKEKLISFTENEELSLNDKVTEESTVSDIETDNNTQELQIGDKFTDLRNGEICEVVSLTGAIPWQTDMCAIKRSRGYYEITEDISFDELLNSERFQRYEETVEKAESINIPFLENIDLNSVDSICIERGVSTYEGGIDSNGHEAKDNYSYKKDTFTLYPSDDKTKIWTSEPSGNVFDDYYDEVYNIDLDGEIALANKIYKYIDRAYDYSIVAYKDGEKQYINADVDDIANYLEKALITDYTRGEFDDEPDFTNPESVGVAYTTVDDKDGIEHTIEATVNLEKQEISKYLDNTKVYTEAYGSKWDFLKCLEGINFDDLTEVTDEMWAKYNEVHKSTEVTNSAEKLTNFTFTEENMNVGSPKEQFQANIDAIKMLKKLESENAQATQEQQAVLAKYMGWGGLSDAFDPHKDSWSKEYNELKELLTYEEYNSARATVLNSHFTSPTIIQAMYKGLEQLGFDGGTILEPSMGIGNFFGAMPKDMQENSKLYGVELDDLTGRIAKQLYPDANIQIKGFQKTDFNSNSFDVAIGNVPFGTNKIYDSEIQSHDLIHDYFFKKALDKVHPSGIVAFVTSMGTMDKANEGVRKYLAERAELVGAVRLPDTAFKNANTSVTSDIIFLKKRDEVLDFEKEPEKQPDWVGTQENQEGYVVNAYFATHPEMIVGEMVEESGPYGNRLVCKPIEGDFKEQLNAAISNLQGTFERDEQANSVEEEIDPEFTQVSYEGHRNFCYCVVDDKVYFRENEMMIPQELEGKRLERMKGLIDVSTVLQEVIRLQREGYSDEDIKAVQDKLNTVYEDFTKKHGLINSDANLNLFKDDDTSELIASLENLDDDGNLIGKSDIFTKRTIIPYVAPTHADTVSDALTISISEKAKVDLEYMTQLCGKDKATILEEMKGVIFENPVNGRYETADEYLSGDIREKLRLAELMAENNDNFAVNVEALKEVMPEDLKPSEISVQLCSTWIPVKYYEQFMYELLDTPNRCKSNSWYANTDPFSTYNSQTISIQFDERTATYGISNKGSSRADSYNIKANQTYGTSRVNAYKILEDTLNNKIITVKDYVEDAEGKKHAVVNQKETLLAQEKQNEIKEKFKEWIWEDPDRTEDLCRIYNDKFNSIRPREYDGSHINFVGMNPEIKLRPHQLNAIAHTLYGGNTLLAHTVGAGKTFEAVASAMEAKRLGLCHKSLICVPKHIVNQFGKEFLQLYPNANILVASEKDFQKKNRRRFFSRVATGNYDAVIISHSQLEKLPISPERRIDYVQNQIEEITSALDDMRKMEGKRGFTVKQLETEKANLETKLEKLINEEKYDTNIFFEDMGFDKMFIDEAHMFKNRQFITKMGRNVSGINASSASQRATDLAMKVQYMDEITGNRGSVFMTGTPLSNSMSELYIMQSYLQESLLKERGLHLFDAWAANFGEVQRTLELAPEGKGYQAKTRFAKFFNLPELMNLFRLCADIKMPEDLNLPVPEAHYECIKTEASEFQKEMVDGLAERAGKIRGGNVDPTKDNMLKITNEGRKLALDQRLINPLLPDDPDSKVNKCVEKVLEIWNGSKERLGTQMIFCDMSTPKPDEFNVYDDIKDKLIANGVPKEEIAYIHDAKTDVQKQELFAKVNKGEVRILLGSTNKMGAGTNCQKHLTAVHHLDCPWRPSDLEQRNGRIIRQGNDNKEVNIYNYVTAGTFDAYLFQLVENKQKFISQIMTSKSPQREAEDVDEAVLNYAQIKALAAGDSRIKEKMDLDMAVTSLRTAYSNFLDNRRNLRTDIVKKYPEMIAQKSEALKGLKEDLETLKNHTTDGFSGMLVGRNHYDERKNAGEALLAAIKSVGLQNTGTFIGAYKGFDMSVDFNKTKGAYELVLKGAISHRVEMGSDAVGNIMRIDNSLKEIENIIVKVSDSLEDVQKQLKIAKEEVEKPFPKMEELKSMEKRLNELNKELSLDKADESEILPEEQNKTAYEAER